MNRFIGLLLAFCAVSTLHADDHAVALIYHHVSTTTPKLTSVTPETFDSHLDYLEANEFTVWPLGRILATLAERKPLPANTVAITFDDAFESVYNEAFPRLRKRNWPFTLFVSSEPIDRGYAGYLSWPQIRELASAGVELGNHSHSHAHLLWRLPKETNRQWKERVTADIKTAAVRLREETGSRSNLFAYPYGEYSPELIRIVRKAGYYGIAQQAGAIGHDSDFLALPRFPMSQAYADLERLATAVNSRPLPVSAVDVKGNNHRSYRPLKSLQIRLAKGDYRAPQLACYRSSGNRLETQTIKEHPLTVSIAITGPQDAGRHKINCTAPANAGDGAYYWWSFQWLVKHADGSWYEE